MYAHASLLSAGITAATGLPYFHLGALDIGLPIQAFGVIVAAGVLIGATPLRRYAEWHGVSDEHIRGLLTWVMVAGFLGAHEFDVIAYNWAKMGDSTINAPASWWPGFLPVGLWPSNWPLPLRIWDGISSYGGFIGGAIGFALYVWWKRLPPRLFADITIVGLLPAFSIGRIGCTVVSDHIGAVVDPGSWYAFLAMDYPRSAAFNPDGKAANPALAELFQDHARVHPGPLIDHLLAWNLGFIEFLYLVPINLIVLWLAFRPSKRLPAAFITVLTGLLYAPVRFLLDFLRPGDTDPPHFGLTFAQWSSILAFGVALYVGRRILQSGAAAEPVTRTSREAQERLRIILREDEETQNKQAADGKAEAERRKAELAQARAERDREFAEELAAAERAKAAKAEEAGGAAGDEDDADEADEVAADAAAPAAPTGATGATGAKTGGAKGKGGGKKTKSRKR
jgi:phosphatidylglycerol:prolipoprotein diacylglycerol transferase